MVCVNKFATDTEAELEMVVNKVRSSKNYGPTSSELFDHRRYPTVLGTQRSQRTGPKVVLERSNLLTQLIELQGHQAGISSELGYCSCLRYLDVISLFADSCIR